MVQYENGDVSAVTYDMNSLDEINVVTAVSPENVVTSATVLKSTGTALYCADPTDLATTGIQALCPVNW